LAARNLARSIKSFSALNVIFCTIIVYTESVYKVGQAIVPAAGFSAGLDNPEVCPTYTVFMRTFLFGLATAAISLAVASAADAPTPGMGKVFDGQIKTAESEVVSLAEAMPADKYDFAPTGGEFKGVRTFGLQMMHIAAVTYSVSASALGEKNPSEIGSDENGPATVKGKDAIVQYLKEAFAYGHKAAGNLTAANAMDMLPSPFGSGKMQRISMLSLIVWHTFDHYGQSVVYARMNGIVPPASRPR
jgi:hypothetical protein